jgi:preprotein translocase YajC subunit
LKGKVLIANDQRNFLTSPQQPPSRPADVGLPDRNPSLAADLRHLLVAPHPAAAKAGEGACQAMIAAVKKGDEVVTGGGLRGRVTKVTDTEVEVEIAQGVGCGRSSRPSARC